MNTSTNSGSELAVQHVQLLRQFSKVAHVLKGVAAMLWLPGLKQKFDGLKSVSGHDKRPIAVTMEVTESGGLCFSGAISRPKDGRMRYTTIFRYEFTSPMRPNAKGETLTSNNEVLARRALGLLRALIRFGERRLSHPRAAQLATPRHPMFLVPFETGHEVVDEAKLTELTEGMHLELVESYRERLRQDLCDRTTFPGICLVNAAIVPDEVLAKVLNAGIGYEDFSPVLGAPHWNPARDLHQMVNPAEILLAAHGVTSLETVTQDGLDALLAAFRGAVPLGERLTEEEICDALCHPQAPVYCAAGVEGIDDARVVTAMRQVCRDSRAAWEATDADLLRAARKPNEPLFLSRLSVTQIVPAEALNDLPAPYCGEFLPPLDWEPPRRSAAKVA